MIASFTIDWYAARAAGLVAYLLVSSSVALGLLLAGKQHFERWPRFALEDVHRFAGVLAGTFIGIHVVMIGIDSQAHLGLAELITPFTSHYRPFWTGLGIVAAELLVALAFTNHYRKRFSHVVWRRLHYLNFAVWLAATGHGLGAGTDAGRGWFLTLYVVTTTTIVLLAIRRFSRSRQPTSRPRPPEAVRLEPGNREPSRP